MKVLIISYEYLPIENGITISLDRIARNLSIKGIEVHIISFSNENNNFNKFYNHKTKVKSEKINNNLIIHRIRPYSGNFQYPAPQEFQEILHYSEKLNSIYNFDLIHGFRLTPGGYAAVILSKKLKKPCIVSIRGNDIGRNTFDFNLFSINKFVLENADRLTFVASDLLDLANIITPIKNKSVVILNSFDSKIYSFHKMPKINPRIFKGKIIGTSGVIRSKKGFVYMIEAFAKYHKKFKSTFLLVGDFKEEEAVEYEKIIDKYKIRDSFVKTGIIDHKYVLNFMKLLDVFLLPSLSEGCSNSMLEAMNLKIPIIATGVGAAKDIIQNEINGLIVEPRNSEQIYNTLIKLNNKKFSEKLASNSFIFLNENLTMEKETNKFIEHYTHLLRKNA